MVQFWIYFKKGPIGFVNKLESGERRKESRMMPMFVSLLNKWMMEQKEAWLKGKNVLLLLAL